MKLLIDTHVLLWWFDLEHRLGRLARSRIANPRNLIHVSAVSVLELALKGSRRRINLKGMGSDELAALPAQCGFVDLPVSARHAAAVLDVSPRIADPFDRLLLAQATCEGLRFITADRLLLDTVPDLIPADR